MALRLTRRQALVGAAAVAAGIATSRRGLPWDTDAAAGSATAGDWADLAAQLTGNLLLPDDPAYPTARLVWNTNYDDVYPQAIVQAATPEDVRAAILFARDTGVRPTPRGGGHSFMGFSTGSGLVIDVGPMNQVQMNRQRTSAAVGAGGTLLHVYRLLSKRGMAIAGGTCPMVGVSGLTQGGGLGPFSREHGLLLDTLTGAQVVTADGRILRANARENADLFWAIRGGGGGNFGVVTEFTFRPVPVDTLHTSIALQYRWRDVLRALMAFQAWVPTLPLNCQPTVILRTAARAPGATPMCEVSLWYRGPKANAEALVDEFVAEVGVAPLSRSTHSGSFFGTEYQEYCAGFRPDECAWTGTTLTGRIDRVGVSIYSDISRRPWPEQGWSVLLDQLERWQRSTVLQPAGVSELEQAGKLILEPINGVAGRVSPTATAFPHRGGFLTYQFQARVKQGASADTQAAAQEWVNQWYSRLTPWRTGAEYGNYGNRQLRDWATAYYGQNLPRLRRIKAQRDPGNLFRFAQSIRPA